MLPSFKKSSALSFHPEIEPVFQVMRLGFNTMPQVLDLLIAGQQALSEKENHFLKPQNLQTLRTHAANFPVIGIVEENSGLIVAAALLTPAEKADYGKNLDAYPPHLLQSGTGIIQSVCVSPDFVNQGLMKKLLKGIEQIAHDEGMFRMLAKVSTQNRKSAKGFLGSEFAPVAKKRDEKLCYNAAYWEKKIGDLALADIPVFNGPHGPNATFSSNIIAFTAPER